MKRLFDIALTEHPGGGLLAHAADCPWARAQARAGKPVVTMFSCERMPSELPLHECLQRVDQTKKAS